MTPALHTSAPSAPLHPPLPLGKRRRPPRRRVPAEVEHQQRPRLCPGEALAPRAPVIHAGRLVVALHAVIAVVAALWASGWLGWSPRNIATPGRDSRPGKRAAT